MIIGLGDKCGGLTLLIDDVGDFIVFCSFSFDKSPLLGETVENLEAVGLKEILVELEAVEIVVLLA